MKKYQAVCDRYFKCPEWEEGMKQIESAQMLAFIHRMKYTGKPFVFCPWCGQKIYRERLSNQAFKQIERSKDKNDLSTA
jgi:hypothetical protein